ncbi:superoxide dismutase family protein [Mycobacterium sp. 1465703.0]|uniref:superoxide dismutase[Cu-Zn] n=1 Tax=Mycobacterium sp. 1465703.0 TaxID=1834078 RepID=UPI000A5BA3F2|nr:superoxide dismutase family protein [Mycobacterium sp. 1465703.0]
MMKFSGSPCMAALLMGLPVVAMTACSSPQHASTQPGTTPPAKSAAPTSPGETTTPAPGGANPAPGGNSLSAELRTPDGRSAATATFDFTGGYVTVTVKTVAPGILTPGIHGLHVHQIGKCEPNSTAPSGGAPGNFLSAGDHYQAPGHTGKPESGDLASLQVRQDGSGYLVTTTDSFTRDDLLAGNKTALMLHGAQDTENAMDRVACGVIGTG